MVLSIYHSIVLTDYLSIYHFVYHSVCLSIYRFVYLSIYLSIFPFVYLSFCLSIVLSVWLSIYLYLSFCLSFCLSLSVCTSSTDNETAIFWLLKKGALIQSSCVRSFAGCADLNLAGLLCVVLQAQWRRQWRFSPANQWSAEFTRHVLVMVRFAWNLNRGGTKKSTRYCTQWKPP